MFITTLFHISLGSPRPPWLKLTATTAFTVPDLNPIECVHAWHTIKRGIQVKYLNPSSEAPDL